MFRYFILEVEMGMKKGEEEKTSRFLKALKVFEVNREVASQAAKIVRDQKSKGLTLGTAPPPPTVCLMTLVTYNRKHYPVEALDFFAVPPLDP